jgi:hypothetical protein
MENRNANQKTNERESDKKNKPLAKGQQKEPTEDENSVDSQSEFSRIEKLRNDE